MRTKLTVALVAIITIAISFDACSDSDTKSTDDSNKTVVTTIEIDVPCTVDTTTSDIESYITLESGDTIIKDEDNTTVSIFYDAEGNEKVCLVEGKAHLLR